MDRRQKSTLRSHHINLANELILDEDFFAALRQNKIFTDGMLQIIKDVRKPRDQVYKMLELLEKRGPTAYENFVWILRENFSWLADQLEETYERKRNREKSSNQHLRRAMSTPQESSNRLKPQLSLPTPISANNFQNPVGKKVFFKSNSSSESLDPREDNIDNIDEQDGVIPKTSSTSSTKHSSEVKTTVKQFEDKCMSPIQIIESPRKPVTSSTSTTGQEIKVIFEDDSNHGLVLDENDKSSGTPPTVEIGDDVFDENNVVDDSDNLEGEEDNAELEDGEIFYDRIRRESEMNETENNDSFAIGADDIDGGLEESLNADDMESELASSLHFGQTEEDSEIQDMYLKLLEATNTQLESEIDLCQIGITYKMLHELIDKLVEDKQTADDSVKMVKKCLSLFSDKDRKIPLSKIIEKLIEEKNDLNNRLLDEMRKTNEMAHDMYMHSQEMKNIDKLKAKINELEKENSLLQMKKLNLERENNEKDRRITELDKNLKLFEELRQTSTEKKSIPNRRNSQRRITPGMPSPRKPSLGPASQMTNLRSSYTSGQSSPRAGASSAWPRHYSKR